MGIGTEDGITVGPLIHEKAADNVRNLIDDAIDSGVVDISQHSENDFNATFVELTVLTNVNSSMRVLNEETLDLSLLCFHLILKVKRLKWQTIHRLA